ncbi:MAG: Lrp/AsnC family transcriptional regulator [Methanobacteriota archaeon]
MVRLDRTNLRLLELLQKDARTSIIELARAVGRAESTVRERIAAMEREGILRGYRAVVDAERLGFRARAFVHADVDQRRVPDLAGRLAAIPNVTGAWLTTGPRPLVFEVVAENSSRLLQVLEDRVAPLELSRVEVDMVLGTMVEPRPLVVAATAPALAGPAPPGSQPSAALAGIAVVPEEGPVGASAADDPRWKRLSWRTSR